MLSFISFIFIIIMMHWRYQEVFSMNDQRVEKWDFLGNHFNRIKMKQLQSTVDCIHENGQWIYHDGEEFQVEYCLWNNWSAFTCSYRLFARKTNSWKFHWTSHTTNSQLACATRSIIPMNVTDFCRVINGKNILIVGDSISNEFAVALLTLFVRTFGLQDCPFSSPFKDSCSKSYSSWKIPCSAYSNRHYPDFNIYFRRNDYVTINANCRETGSVFEGNWIQLLGSVTNTSILILNSGLHYRTNKELLSSLSDTFGYLKLHYPNVSVIWRSSHQGHVDWNESRYDQPLDSARPWFIENSSNYYNPKWNWDKIYLQNNLVRELIYTKYPQILFWNIYNLTDLRHDSHRGFTVTIDGLHYCMPGPINEWVNLFYNIILATG